MSAYADRARAIVKERLRVVFRAWLAALPAAGWSGTAGDLSVELAAFLDTHALRHGASVPAGAGLSRWLQAAEADIAAADRRLRFTRTKSERRVIIA